MYTPRFELAARRILGPFVNCASKGTFTVSKSGYESSSSHLPQKKKIALKSCAKVQGTRFTDIRVSSDSKLGNASHYRTHARNSRKQRIALSMQRRCRIGRSDTILKSNTPRRLKDTARSRTHSELIEYIRTKHGVFLGGTA